MNWIERLLSDHSIPHVTEGHKHVTDGWVNVHCPFCRGSQNFHLGISVEHGGGHCWRCGGHSLPSAVSRLLDIPYAQAQALIQQYRGPRVRLRRASKTNTSPANEVILPQPNAALGGAYAEYLSNRGFDPERTAQEWGLLQTGPVSLLDGISYSHRILIPIHWNGKLVSYQARDITNRSPLKYLACPKAREAIHHKTILYGKQAAWAASRVIVVVEGVTDVWRFGEHAAATFGIEFTLEQVLQLTKHGDQFFIVFDNEPQAQRQARKLHAQLRALNKTARIETVATDPGNMAQEEAAYFVEQLLPRRYY